MVNDGWIIVVEASFEQRCFGLTGIDWNDRFNAKPVGGRYDFWNDYKTDAHGNILEDGRFIEWNIFEDEACFEEVSNTCSFWYRYRYLHLEGYAENDEKNKTTTSTVKVEESKKMNLGSWCNCRCLFKLILGNRLCHKSQKASCQNLFNLSSNWFLIAKWWKTL